MQHKGYFFRYILSDAGLFTLIVAGLHFGLSLFDLKFRQWIYLASIIPTVTGVIAGMIQLLLKIRKRALKIILIIVWNCLAVNMDSRSVPRNKTASIPRRDSLHPRPHYSILE